jgi:hypothetical protein
VKSYYYYATQSKLAEDKNLHIPCEVVDQQIPDWLMGVGVKAELIPQIREGYKKQVKQATQEDREVKIGDLKRRISQLREEETRLGRMLITGKLSEVAYDQLRLERQEKLRNTELSLADMERKTAFHIDDLEVALILLSKVGTLFERLDLKMCRYWSSRL